MFDFIHNNKSVQLAMKLLLGLISLSFIAFTAANYTSLGQRGDDVAQVGRTTITRQQVERELQQNNLGPDNVERVTNELVQRQLLIEKAHAVGLTVTPDDLRKFITNIPAFQKDGRFDPVAYSNFLQNRRLNADDFEKLLSDDILVQKLMGHIAGGSFTSKLAREHLASYVGEQREVSQVRLDARSYMDKVKVGAEQIATYYKSHTDEFKLPEQVRLEYLVLSPESVAASQPVTEQEEKTYYEANRAQLEHEERLAKHILFTVPPKADAAAKQAVKAQAEKVLAEVRQHPDRFAALAKQYSQDPGSAQNGGALQWSTKEAYVPEFSAALFSMQLNQISDLVQTQYGYHIIQLDGIRKTGFAEAKPQIDEAIRMQKVRQLLPQMTEKLGDLIAEHDKNLTPVAQALNVPLQTSSWVSRDGLPGDPRLSNKDVLEKVFTPQSLAGSATDVLELPNQERAVFRVTARQPARTQTLQEVSAAIENKLKLQGASKLATAEGEQKLAALKKGESLNLAWSTPAMISRQNGNGLSEGAVKLAFALPEKDQPQYAGRADDDGYTLLKVGKLARKPADKAVLDRIQQMLAQSEGEQFMKSLEAQTPVKIYVQPKAANE